MSEQPRSTGAAKRPAGRYRSGLTVLGPVGVVGGWATVAVLGLVALMRLVAWDSLEPLIVLDSLTLIIYLPAWIVAIGAAVTRKWWLALGALVIVVAQVIFVAPEFLAAAQVPSWTRHAELVN